MLKGCLICTRPARYQQC